MDIQEIIRRVRAGQSDRAIHEDLGVHRNTVKKYRQWVEQHDLLEGELPGFVNEWNPRFAARRR